MSLTIRFGDGPATPPERAPTELDHAAEELARTAVALHEKGEPRLPVVHIVGHDTGLVDGLPHFGQALRAGMDRAQAVRSAFRDALGSHPTTLQPGATRPLRADDVEITTESRGLERPPGSGSSETATVLTIDASGLRRP